MPPTSAMASTPSVVDALPAMTRPPQSPGVELTEVINTGAAAVPLISISPPFWTTMYLSVPTSEIMVVPAGMVRVTPASTLRVPLRRYTMVGSRVRSSSMLPLRSSLSLGTQAFGQEPPQSIPSSSPFWMPSVQLGGSGSLLSSSLLQLVAKSAKTIANAVIRRKMFAFIIRGFRSEYTFI